MSEEDQTIDVVALPKFDMSSYESNMSAKDVKSLALCHGIPLDLHPIALTKGWTMDQLSNDMIGLLNIGPSVNLFRVFHKVSRKGHWFSFEKIVGKGAGCQIFQETFSRLKGWKKRFFFLDRRAITNAMAWRHHDSDISDFVPEDGFSEQDVQTLAERVIDLRPVPFDLLFQGGLAPTWEFPGFLSHFLFAMVTMSEYLRFPFLSGATIKKGNALTNQDQRVQHTVPPIPVGQAISNKTGHQKEVEVEDPKIVATCERKARAAAKKIEKKKQRGDGGEGSRPKTKRRKTISRKDGLVASEATSSLEPIRTLNPTQPSGALAATPKSREDRSPRMFPHDSSNHYVHNYFDVRHDEETNNLRLGPSGDQSWRALTNVNTKVIQPSLKHEHAHHSPTVKRMATHLRIAPQGANTEASESSRESVFYVPKWSIHRRCRVDTPMWCRELMTNVLERFKNLQAEFGRLAESHAECGDMAEKLVQARLNLEHSSHLYTSSSDRYKAFKSNHEDRTGKLEGSENHNIELSKVNKDQALWIKELEDELDRKDSDLVYAERLNSRGFKREKNLLLNSAKQRWKSLIAYVNSFLLWWNVFFKVMSISIACPNPLTWLSKPGGEKDSARRGPKRIS
nr:hypothetical protein [Tanacetum cinerariifolium]